MSAVERVELARKCTELPSGWQRVIHGDALDVRRSVVESLIANGKPNRALRYALCGCGDQIGAAKTGEGVAIAPRGCGHGMCPRCGRRKAGRFVRRVTEWMAHVEHGDLFNVCFTQRVEPGETAKQSRDRLQAKLRPFMRWATRQGLVAGMTVHHCAYSSRYDGWHYHCHAVLEFPAGRFVSCAIEGTKEEQVQEFADQWVHQGRVRGEHVMGLYNRPLLKAGPRILGLVEDTGDAEFWSESKDPVAAVIQYPLRDLAQGVSATRLGGSKEVMDRAVDELVRTASCWKMRRCWGRWRKRCPEAKEYEDGQKKKAPELVDGDGKPEDAKAPLVVGKKTLGTVRRVFLAARAGHLWARTAFIYLEDSVRNDSNFARRLVLYCRAARGDRQTGSG